MILTRWNPAFIILALLMLDTTANAAAPHIIIYYGVKLQKPIIIDEWEENHRLMSSLSEEGLVKPEEISSREYIELSLFSGPQWLKYKLDGGSASALRPEQGNQNGRLYMGTENSQPILHLEGRLPRYVGDDGGLMLSEHGIPTRTATSQSISHSLKRPWLLALAFAVLIATTITFFVLRQRRTGLDGAA
jgi:hypothetical protein